jgi:hypothetical protein
MSLYYIHNTLLQFHFSFLCHCSASSIHPLSVLLYFNESHSFYFQRGLTDEAQDLRWQWKEKEIEFISIITDSMCVERTQSVREIRKGDAIAEVRIYFCCLFVLWETHRLKADCYISVLVPADYNTLQILIKNTSRHFMTLQKISFYFVFWEHVWNLVNSQWIGAN